MNTIYASLNTTFPAGSQIGICAVDLDPARLDEIQLTPDGLFGARDGRPEELPGWLMNAANAVRVIAAAAARENPFVIDYEHQTLRADANGQPAPAAGWFEGNDIEYRAGRGLFARVTWTDRARKMIAAGEYKFISPVLLYNKLTGDVLGIYNAALTNNPAIDGMDDVLARAAAVFGNPDSNEENNTVNWKEKLIELLGLDKDADDDKVLAAIRARIDSGGEGTAEMTQMKIKLDAANTQIAELKASGAEPDPQKYVPVKVVEELRTQIAALSTKQRDSEVEDMIEAALSDERGPLLLEAQLDWARDLGKKDLDALKKYLDTATPIAALRGQSQTSGRRPPSHSAPMDESQTAILSNLGLDSKAIESIQQKEVH